MKSPKHYEAWPLAESKRFIQAYLDGVRNTDNDLLLKSISQELGRSKSAIKLRVLEAKRILGHDADYPIITPNMEVAVEWALTEYNYSKTKMLTLL
jgi:hypothetical protein